jgi:hypothetical protein
MDEREKVIFFFFICPHKRGKEIRTSDLRFTRRGPKSIELPLENEREKVMDGRELDE